jgi:hypothetical protein
LTGLSSEHDLGITSNYSGSYVFRNIRSVGSLYAPGGTQALTHASNLSDRSEGFNEQGYINLGDYVTHEFVDGTYAGSTVGEFSLNFRNAQVNADDPAVVNIRLGALVRYPGFFESNNGFLSDSIFIQDSKYYQAFSYVIKIDERLASYKSAVKTMLHPAGMALFGEFQITNEYDLSLELESLVKSLGIGLESEFFVLDSQLDIILTVAKVFSSTIDEPTDLLTSIDTFKALVESQSLEDSTTLSFTKLLGSSATMESTSTTFDISKPLSTIYSGFIDNFEHVTTKSLSDEFLIDDDSVLISLMTDKYLQTSTLGFTESGSVWFNPYTDEDYFLTATDYNEFSGSTF